MTKYNYQGFLGNYSAGGSSIFESTFSKDFLILGAPKKINVRIASNKKFDDKFYDESYDSKDEYIQMIIQNALDDVNSSIKKLNSYLTSELKIEINSHNISLLYAEKLIESDEPLYISYSPEVRSAFHAEHSEDHKHSVINIDLTRLTEGLDFVLFHELLHMFSMMAEGSGRAGRKEDKDIFIEDKRPDKTNLSLLSGGINEEGEFVSKIPNDVFIIGSQKSFEFKAFNLAEYILTRVDMSHTDATKSINLSYRKYNLFETYKHYFKDVDEALELISLECGAPKESIDSLMKCAHVLKEDHVSLSIRQIKNSFRENGITFRKDNLSGLLLSPNLISPGETSLWTNTDIVRIYLSTSSSLRDIKLMSERLYEFKDLAKLPNGMDSKKANNMNNKIMKLYKFLKASKHHSEARYLEKIAFPILAPPKDVEADSLEFEVDDALENIYREEIGISLSDAAKSKLSDYALDIANYCGSESIEMVKYIRFYDIDEPHSAMRSYIDSFSEQYNFKIREIKEGFLDNLKEDLGISSYNELRNKAKEEGYHIENTPLSTYLKEEFHMECRNYLAERINLRDDLMEDYCEYVSKVYKALKKKEEGSKKIDLQISNVSNACKIYSNITLDEVDKNIEKYNYNDLSSTLGCIIGEGSYLAYYEYPKDKIDYLEVNHPKILVKLEELRKKEESGYHKY